MADHEQQGRGLTRRRFVVAGAGALAAAGLHGVPGVARARARGRSAPFAVVADSHLDPYSPGHTANMRAVFEHILVRAERPAFVAHVGDVVEAGFPAEYEEWRRVLPDALAGAVHAVPGNHEVRWDEWAMELYFADLEPTPYSFDAAGVHVVALDPTQLLQEPGYFSRAQLEWLYEDLRRAGRDVPSVVFVHYPMSGDYFYVGNQEELLRAVEGFDVRAVFAGHIHREDVARVNGITFVALPGILNTAAYHWVAPARRVDGSRVLAVTRAQRGAAGWQEAPVAEIALDGERRALRRAPLLRAEAASDRSRVEVVADVHPGQDAATARARFTPEATFGGRSDRGWILLGSEQGGRRWRGSIDASALAAGRHRLQVQAAAADGARWEATEAVELPTTPADRLGAAWERDLGAAIQAGTVPLPGDRLVAATVAGTVVALDASRPRERWRRTASGPVYGTPAADPAGRRVFVPTATGALHAFDADGGREAWRFSAPRPALAAPVMAADGDTVVAAAGRALHALEAASGSERWRADARGFVGGRPAADDRAVYAGAGDGKVRAFSLTTGEPLWERVLASRESPYRTLIYSPWATQAALLPGDRVLVATVTNAWALERSTGAVAWQLRGGFMYNAPLLLPDRLLMVDEWGAALAVDPLTGTELWRTTLPQRVLGGSPARWGDAVAIAGVNGLIALLDPATGADVGRLRAGVDYVHGAPAVAGELLVVGSQDGRLQALELLRSR